VNETDKKDKETSTMNLNRENFPRELQIGASAPEATGIVHIGTAQFHRAHAALPVNARSFALRIHEAERVSRALVGGFPIVTIPSLDSLPLALRKAVS